MGGEVGEAVRGHLVGHREHVAHVLDGEVAFGLRVLQERHRGLLRHQDRRGEVVRLDALSQEVGEVAGLPVAEAEVAEGLQQDGSRAVHAQ